MKGIKQLSSAFLAVALLLCTGCAQTNSHIPQEYAQSYFERMSNFVSGFSELGFLEVTDKFKSDPESYVHFAVRHNYVNNFSDRISPVTDESGMLSMDVKYAQESLKEYLGLDVSTWPSTSEYTFENNKYVFMGADGEMVLHAKVTTIEDKPAEDAVLLIGYFYNAEDEEDRYGTFEALVKKHEWQEKDAWYMVTMTHTPAEALEEDEKVEEFEKPEDLNLSREDCFRISSRVKPGTITIKKAFEAYNAFYIVYSQGGDNEYQEQVPWGDRELYNKYVGQTVKVEYTDAQYFDEHAGKCIQDRDFITINGEEF